MESLWLPLLILIPAAGALVTAMLPGRLARVAALGISSLAFVLSIFAYLDFQALAPLHGADGGYVLMSSMDWVGGLRYDIKFLVGVDGISIYLVLLTTLLFPLSILFSWNSVSKNETAYYSLLLLLMSGVLGVFVALDLILFYLFFELGLIPMYFLIGMWGGKERVYAALKFFLYTLVGSLLMLLAIVYVGDVAGNMVNGGIFTTDLTKMLNPPVGKHFDLPGDVQRWLFWGFALSFLIKVPVFPLHTWLPDAHVQAPTAGSVILAGVLLKMGTYGLVRFCLPMFPFASVEYAGVMGVIGVIGIIYGAMAAMVQTDVKKLVAYSSVAHMGFIVLGIFSMDANAVNGAVLQMINHGISTGALFLIVGMIYDRRHTRMIADFQGLATVMPTFTLMFMLATFSSIGLPGMNGFVGEFLVLLGSYQSPVLPPALAVIGAAGVIVAAVYMLWMFRRVMFGEVDKEENRNLKDLTRTEVGVLLPLVALMFIIGVWATPFLQEIGFSVDPLVQRVLNASDATTAAAMQP